MGSNPDGTKNIFIFSRKKIFYYFFLSFVPCIELVIPWGMFTNHVDPLGGKEVLFSSLMWDLAHCAHSDPNWLINVTKIFVGFHAI